MKKTIAVLVVFCMLLSVALTACAAGNGSTAAERAVTVVLQIGSPTMQVNGVDMPIDERGTAPTVIHDRTLLPVRAVIEQMGGTVAWDGAAQAVTL